MRSLTLLYVFTVGSCFAQQEPASDLFWNKLAHYNPASIGITESFAVNLHGRSEWDNINGNPKSLSFNTAKCVSKLNSSFGISFQYDELGSSKMNVALLNYAYQINFENSVLSIGASAGVGNYRYESVWNINNASNSEILPERFSDIALHTDAGIVYHHSKFNLGIGATQLNSPRYSGDFQSYTAVPHLTFFGDYTFKLKDQLNLIPKILLQTDLSKVSVNGSLLALIKEKFWTGLNYSNMDSFGAFVGYDIANKYRIGYSYSRRLFYDQNGNNHELTLGYLLKK